MGHKVFEDGVIDILTWPLDGNHNGVTAENVAKKYQEIGFDDVSTFTQRKRD